MVTPDRPLTLVHATPAAGVRAGVRTPARRSAAAGQTWVGDPPQRRCATTPARPPSSKCWPNGWNGWTTPPSPRPCAAASPRNCREVSIASPPLRKPGAAQRRRLYDALGSGSAEAAHAHTRHEFGDHKFRLVSLPPARHHALSRIPAAQPSPPTPPTWCAWARCTKAIHSRCRQPTRTNTPTRTHSAAALARRCRTGRAAAAQQRCHRARQHRALQPPAGCAQDCLRGAHLPLERAGERRAAGIASIRRGNGLRVYLERPWFSSGEGELLGVVVGRPHPAEQPFPNLPDALIGFVSQWGQDPDLGQRPCRAT